MDVEIFWRLVRLIFVIFKQLNLKIKIKINMNPVISQFHRLAMLSEKERFIVADNSNPLVVNGNFA